ncbi:hypothetical protein LOZ43_006248, partial [Ophidiomyces ophidiicola]
MSALPHHDMSSLSDTESFESGEVLPSHDVSMSDSDKNLWVMATPSGHIPLQNCRPTGGSSNLL